MTTIALHTYGTSRIKTETGEVESAYKFGTRDAAEAMLLLYGNHATDLSTKRMSYSYIHVTAPVVVTKGYIVIANVSDDDIKKIAQFTARSYRPTIWAWREGAWWEFPHRDSAEWRKAEGWRLAPSFTPDKTPAVDAQTGEKTSAIKGVKIERVQRGNETPWWWVSGETYPHRDVLKAAGGRWSRRRKSWYFIMDELPQAVLDLEHKDGDNPLPELTLQPEPQQPEPQQPEPQQPEPQQPEPKARTPWYALDQSVYARGDLRNRNGTTVPFGKKGKVIGIYEEGNGLHQTCYDVLWVDKSRGWYFQAELEDKCPIRAGMKNRGEITLGGQSKTLSEIRISIEARKKPNPDHAILTPIAPEEDEPIIQIDF